MRPTVPRRAPLPRLAEPDGAAWGGFLRAHAQVTRRLDAELRTATGIDLNAFEVLLHLAWAGGTARMGALARELLFTASGITRIVTRLEDEGLVTRDADPDDGRSIAATLTPPGWRALRAAHRVHLDGIRRWFLAPVGAAAVPHLADAFRRVLAGPPPARARAGRRPRRQ